MLAQEYGNIYFQAKLLAVLIPPTVCKFCLLRVAGLVDGVRREMYHNPSSNRHFLG